MRFDIFKRTFCKKCNFGYDPHLDSCPKCKEINDEYIPTRNKNPLLHLDLLRCLLIVGISIFLTYVLGSIVVLITASINPDLVKDSHYILWFNFILS